MRTGALREAIDCWPNSIAGGEIISASGWVCAAPKHPRARTSTPEQTMRGEINGGSAREAWRRRWPYPAAHTWRPLRAQPRNHVTCRSKGRSFGLTVTFDARSGGTIHAFFENRGGNLRDLRCKGVRP